MNRPARLAAAACFSLLQACVATVAQSAHNGDAADVFSYVRRERGSAGARFTERIDGIDCRDCTLLHFAARGGSIEVADLLVALGADPNATDQDGQTPLHWACVHQHVEMVRFLLAHGAQRSLSMSSTAGHTPLLIAVAIVGTRNVSVPTVGGVALVSQSALPSVEVVRLLLDAGAELSAPGRGGNTALHLAASRGHAEMVRLLLSRGADRASRNTRGETPEALAERLNHPDVVKLLRDAAPR